LEIGEVARSMENYRVNVDEAERQREIETRAKEERRESEEREQRDKERRDQRDR